MFESKLIITIKVTYQGDKPTPKNDFVYGKAVEKAVAKIRGTTVFEHAETKLVGFREI